MRIIFAIFLFVAVGLLPECLARRNSRRKSPLLMGRKFKHSQTRETGCWLGPIFYEIDEEFNPIVPPYGRVDCTKCVCQPIFNKSGKLLNKGEVRCRPIDCPRLTCSKAIRLPGECCKRCENEDLMAEEPNDQLFGSPSDDPERPQALGVGLNSDKIEFAAILTSETQSFLRKAPTGEKMLGHLEIVLTHERMYYSLTMSESASVNGGHAVLRIHINDEVTILEQNVRRGVPVVCGTSKKLPKTYRRYLEQEKLVASIETDRHPNGTAVGQIVLLEKFLPKAEDSSGKPLELLNSFLHEPDAADQVGSGLISFWLQPRQLKDQHNALGFRIWITGSLSGPDKRQLLMDLVEARTGKLLIRTSAMVNLNDKRIDGQFDRITRRIGRLLVSGRVRFTLADGVQRHILLSGVVSVKRTCHSYVSALAMRKSDSEQKFSSGYIALSMEQPNKGSANLLLPAVNGKLLLDTSESDVSYLAVDHRRGVRRRQTQSITVPLLQFYANPKISMSSIQFASLDSSLTLRDIDKLFSGRMYGHVATRSHPEGLLRGRLIPLPSRTFFDYSKDEPYIFERFDSTSNAAALLWLKISSRCKIEFTLLVDGLSSGGKDNVHMDKLLQLQCYDKMNTEQPNGRLILSKFRGSKVFGGPIDGSPACFDSISTGTAVAIIRTFDSPLGALHTRVQTSNSCSDRLMRMAQNDGRHLNDADINDDADKSDSEEDLGPQDCQHPDDGSHIASGQAFVRGCETCVCKEGKVRCEPTICPVIATCNNGRQVPGQCCHVCSDSPNRGCVYGSEQRYYAVGEAFHPWMMPVGVFETRITCRCQLLKDNSTKVACTRNSHRSSESNPNLHRPSPPITPPPVESLPLFRPRPAPRPANHDVQQDQRATTNSRCHRQGKTFDVGQTWTLRSEDFDIVLDKPCRQRCRCIEQNGLAVIRCSRLRCSGNEKKPSSD